MVHLDDRHERPGHPDQRLNASLSRRQLLRMAAFGGLSAGGLALLAACGGTSQPAPEGASTSTTAASSASTSTTTTSSSTSTSSSASAGASSPSAAGASTPAAGATTSGAQSGGQTMPAGAKKGGTLIVGNEADMNEFDPSKATGTHAGRTLRNIFEPLVSVFNDSSQIQGALASKWDISSDGTTYTFTLRDSKFHDGTPVTAPDVQFTFQRQFDPNNDWYKKTGPFPYGNSEVPYLQADKTEVVDPKTVKFYLSQPDSTFLANLTWSNMGIYPAAAFQKVGNDFGLHPIGAGPFKYTSFEKGTSFVIDRFDDYWAGPPLLDKVIFKPVVEDAARLVQLQAGQLDLVPALPPQFVSKAKSDQNLDVHQMLGNHVWWAVLNVHEKPFADKRVRQAMNYAIDKNAIIQSVLGGLAQVAPSFAYPNTPYYSTDVQQYPYDPNKAKQLLSDAGYAGGFSTTYLVPESGSGMIAPKEIATVMQSQLAQIGVNTKLQVLEWTSYLAAYFGGLDKSQAGMAQMSWMVPQANPGMYANELLMNDGGLDAGYYDNPDANKLMLQARATTDEATRANLYKQAAKIIVDDAPWIFMFYSDNVVASNKKVQNVVLNPDYNTLHLERIWVK